MLNGYVPDKSVFCSPYSAREKSVHLVNYAKLPVKFHKVGFVSSIPVIYKQYIAYTYIYLYWVRYSLNALGM